MRDRGSHIGVSELGEHGSIGVLDHRVDHALRVHHHLDLVRRGVEEPAGLDDLEALVHHRRRVDRDLSAHLPIRVRAGLIRRDRRQQLRRGLTKGSARGGEQDALDANRIEPIGKPRRHTLEDGIVLAIDGHQQGTAVGSGPHHDVPGNDQRLLVGEQHPLAGPRRRQGRLEASRPDDRRHHIADLIQGSDGLQCLGTLEHLGRRRHVLEALAQLGGGGRVDHHRVFGAHLPALLGHALGVAMRAERHDAKAIGMAHRHIERAHTDRPRGAQYRETDHRLSSFIGRC